MFIPEVKLRTLQSMHFVRDLLQKARVKSSHNPANANPNSAATQSAGLAKTLHLLFKISRHTCNRHVSSRFHAIYIYTVYMLFNVFQESDTSSIQPRPLPKAPLSHVTTTQTRDNTRRTQNDNPSLCVLDKTTKNTSPAVALAAAVATVEQLSPAPRRLPWESVAGPGTPAGLGTRAENFLNGR